jgi:putative FmdB family regulatory protein
VNDLAHFLLRKKLSNKINHDTMPTYEYKRKDGSVFEIIQGMNDKPLTACPTTGQPVKRIITGGGGVVYKGTGWYVTDYKTAAGKTVQLNPNQPMHPKSRQPIPPKSTD